jgi:hypothetical protein
MTPEINQAIEDLRAGFPDHTIRVVEEPGGGAFVIVENLPIGSRLAPSNSWIGFALGFQYPLSDIYPYYLRHDLTRTNGQPIAAPLSAGAQMPGFDRPALLLSRRSYRWDPKHDTALRKFHRILAFLREEI